MWKLSQSFEGWEVSEKGLLRCRITNKYDKRKSLVQEDGYYYATFSRLPNGYMCFGNRGNYLVHRAVAEAFIPNPNNLPCVNHKDGNKNNNEADNLEWVTHQQNSLHAVKGGLIKTGKASHMYGKRGAQHPCHASNLGNKWNVGRRHSEETRLKISRKLKGNKNALGRIINEETRQKMRIAALKREKRKKMEKKNETI